MASIDPTTKTTYATTDWDQYQRGRPPYPPSLTEIIYNYRRQHPAAGWERLVDIGAGSGVASTNFMADFKVVHNSDPSPWNEEQARTFLTGWAGRHGLSTVFEYSQSTGEDAYKHTGEKQADLVICATAAHFMDPDGLVASISKILRPGGTLAVFSYWMPTFPDQSQRFHDIFAETWEKMVLIPLQLSGDDQSRATLARVIERRTAGNGVLDCLPLPEEFYEDPLRVYINSGPGEAPYNPLFIKFATPNREPGGITRVSPRDRILTYFTGTDPEADGWSFEADKKWLPVFVNTIRPANKNLSEEESRDAYAEWDRIFDKECPTGKLRVRWPAYVVLATKK